MWWACVSVGAPRWALPGQTASLWLPVCVSVIVCGFLCVCRCLCPAPSQLFVYAAGLGRVQGFAGSCYWIPVPPKTWTLRFFCAPWMAPGLVCRVWLFSLFNPRFHSHLNLPSLLSEIYGRLNAAVFWRQAAPSCFFWVRFQHQRDP